MDPFHQDNPQEAGNFYNSLCQGDLEKARYHAQNVRSFMNTPQEWDRQMAYRDPQMMRNYAHATGRYAEMSNAAIKRYQDEHDHQILPPGVGGFPDLQGRPSAGTIPNVGGFPDLQGRPSAGTIPSGGVDMNHTGYRGKETPYDWQDFNWLRQMHQEAPAEARQRMNQVLRMHNVTF